MKVLLERLECRMLFNDTLLVNATQPISTITDAFLGVNYVAYWDSNQGDAASMRALHNAGIQVLRFGGGEPANYYDWANPTLDGWSSTTPASLSAYAKGVGAQLLLQTNPTTNHSNDPSPAHAAAWVAYNKANGINAPYWEIGNESDGAGNNGLNALKSNYDWSSYQSYIDTWNAQAAAMHAADPSIKIYGNTGTNEYYWWQLHSLDMFLNKTGNRFGSSQVDGISVHYYPNYTNNPTWANVEGLSQNWPARMAAITQMMTANDTRNLPVIITETNASDGSNSGAMNNSLASALANADLIGAYKNSGVQQVDLFGSIHSVTNSWGILYGSGDSGTLDQASPKYWMLPIWSHAGNIVLGQTELTDPSNTLSAYASQSANGNVQEIIINKTAAARTVDVSFNGFNPAGKQVKIYELKGSAGGIGDSTVTYNGVTNPDPTSAAGLPAPTTVAATGATYERTVPAYSMTLLDFQVNNAALTPVTRITSPGNTGLFDGGRSITLSADAISSANDGISKVEFYNGAALLGTAVNGTYNNFAAIWNNVPPGTYNITSKAYDTNGTTTISAPVSITVETRAGFGSTPTVTGSGTTIIQAENFDQGGEGFAYHWLNGSTNAYRASDIVNLTASTDTGGGYDITNAQNSDWLAYTFKVTAAGTYGIGARVTDATIGGKFHIDIDGTNVTGSMNVPYTGNSYLNIGADNIPLTTGTHVLRVVMESSNPATNGTVGNFNYFYFTPGSLIISKPATPTVTTLAGDENVTLNWTLVPGILGFNIYRGTVRGDETLYQGNYTGNSFIDSNLNDGQTYYYQVSAIGSGGESALTAELPVTPLYTLPNPWKAIDIGGPTIGGWTDYSASTFSVHGSGSDIWNGSDQFQFVYQPVTGNQTIIAHISQTLQNTANWAKVGVMIRQNLTSGAANAAMIMTPGNWAMLDYRTTSGDGTSNSSTAIGGIATPNWVKLVRAGNSFTGYYSSDGITWTQTGSLSPTITMTGMVYIGLAVVSDDNTKINTATFSSVSILPAPMLSPLSISGSNFYLRENADGSHLDIWKNSPTPGSGVPTQSAAMNTLSAITLNGSGPVNTLTVDFTNGNPFNSGITFTGTGANSLVVDLPTAGGAAQIGASAITFNSTPINFPTSTSITINGGGGNDTLTQTAQPGGPVNFKGGAGDDTLNVNAGTYTFTTNPVTTTTNLTVNDNAAIVFTAGTNGSGFNPRTLAGLNVGSGATVTMNAPITHNDRAVLVLGALAFAGTVNAWKGQLDLNGNDLIVHNGNLSSITSQLKSGFNANGSYWDGQGINSSAAATDPLSLTTLGAEQYQSGSFDGQPNLLGTDVLVKYTFYGDADLNGKVDGTDYSLIDHGFIANPDQGTWGNGDFNYDGKIDGSDYTLIDNAFNQQSAVPMAVPATEVARKHHRHQKPAS